VHAGGPRAVVVVPERRSGVAARMLAERALTREVAVEERVVRMKGTMHHPRAWRLGGRYSAISRSRVVGEVVVFAPGQVVVAARRLAVAAEQLGVLAQRSGE
jgi:hypothetical protein